MLKQSKVQRLPNIKKSWILEKRNLELQPEKIKTH